MKQTSKVILDNLTKFIKEVIGEEWIEGIEITSETSFSNDLEMESIEIVEFAEKVKLHYDDDVDFVGWLSKMELDQIINLKVGEVVEYIHSCLS
ncbi:MAG: acyl carrier protein [Candidatus Schekmanbacteria bacterium RBG_13_48_7]|uniref:Acyl carrier protein n=1 Tax=Candidatus Schekmanbacteria bacterium RBG_13_48_7 TaxID=1817878 RepID=A0A1F7RRX6_9BACT|nr:MAG: acyl carrier protein [Candidatus Schekmanbacteria bacterium RBG_13_48_7]